MQPKTPHPANNPITLLGGVLAVVAFGGLVFFLGIQILDVTASPYLGMLIYMGLPAVLVVGLILIPVGIGWEARRRHRAARRGLGPPPALQIDFGNARHLRGGLLFATATLALLGGLGSAGFRAVGFMESPAFFGALRHTAMGPQYA